MEDRCSGLRKTGEALDPSISNLLALIAEL
jgi:hypothetical protein